MPSARVTSRLNRIVTALISASVVALVLLAGASSASAATLAQKRAQAATLDAQVQEIELRADHANERYRGTMWKLREVRGDVRVAAADLRATTKDLGSARRRLGVRAAALYRTGNGSLLEELMSAGSIGHFFARIDASERVGQQDAEVLERIDALKERLTVRTKRLRGSERRAATLARAARTDQREVEELLSKRESALAAVNDDIRSLVEAQRRAAQAAAAREARSVSVKVTTGAAPSDTSGSDPGPSIPLPPGSSTAAAAAQAALSKLGSPYVWAGSGPDVFDCSGLVMWAFAQAGRSGMPHSSYILAGMGVDVPVSQVQAGDLVFGSGDGHVGIAIGGGSFVHAPHSGDVVKVTSMSDYTITHARRI